MAIMETSIVDPTQKVPKSVNDAIRAQTAKSEAAYQRELAGTPSTSGLPETTETGEPSITEIKNQTGFTPRDTSELDRLRTSATGEIDEAAIQEQEQARIKAQIESIQRQADIERAVLAKEAEQRTGQTRAVGARSGLLGSTFGQAQAQETEAFSAQQRGRFEEQVNAQIQAVVTKAEDRASKEIEAQRVLQSQDYDRYIVERGRLQTEARNDLMLLGSQGGTLDNLDPSSKDLLLQQSDMSEFAANAVMLGNNPQANAKYQVMGDKIVGYYFDPASGEIKTIESEAIDGLDPGANIQTYDGVPYVMTTDENGKISGEILPGFQQEDSFKFQKGTKSQPAGWFNETTGVFTPLSEGAPAGAPSRPGNDTTPEDTDITYAEWLDALQEQEQTTYNISDPAVEAALQQAYENQTGNKASQIKLSSTQYNKALTKYKSATGNSESSFNRLSQSEKLNWYNKKSSTQSTTEQSYATESTPDLGEYNFDDNN